MNEQLKIQRFHENLAHHHHQADDPQSHKVTNFTDFETWKVNNVPQEPDRNDYKCESEF